MTGVLDVIACGMVTAVGLDAPSAAAAMRARLDGFQETRFPGGDGGWLIGAPVPMPRGFIGEKRMAHMAAAAILECFDAVPAARTAATPLILCLAETARPGRPVADPASLVRRIGAITGIEAGTRARAVEHGRPSGVAALQQAARLIAGGARHVVIAGIDSYLTTLSVAHFAAERRLLMPGNADGFIPGEAAAAIIVGPPGSGAFRLASLGLAREPAFIYNGLDADGAHLPLRGDGMVAAYRQALDAAGIEMRDVGYRISDLIGESWFFRQSALASLRLVRGHHGFQDLLSPAESVGNVGAAVVPMMIGLAMTAARKGYDGGDPVLVEASGDDGACGVALLTAGRMPRPTGGSRTA
jgi:3-oxoacyl-[acyl-carrier-protein] synthase-1